MALVVRPGELISKDIREPEYPLRIEKEF